MLPDLQKYSNDRKILTENMEIPAEFMLNYIEIHFIMEVSDTNDEFKSESKIQGEIIPAGVS